MPRHAADRKCCGVSKFVDQKRRSFFRKRQKIHPLPSIIGSVRNSDHAKGAGGVFLHYEIFLDLLFAENLLLNYTILRLSSFLLKRSATRRRSFAAAAFGAGYAVLYAVLARYLPGALLALVGIGITTGMVKSGCRITTVRDLAVGMAGYILSGFLIGSAYRLFRELMPGRGILLFLLSGSAAYAGTLLLLKIRKEMLLEHARQVTVQLVQNGKWKKSKRTVRHGQYFAGCHNQKAGLGRTVHCDTRIVPGRNADRDCGACKARDGAGAGTASCAAAPLHTVSRTGRPGLSAGDPDLGNDSCDRTYSQAHKRTADCAWRRK